MKRIRASVHREVRFNMRGCANQLNTDNNDRIRMQTEESTLVRSRRCHSKYRDQFPTASSTFQKSLWPAKSLSATMLYVLYLSALYLVATTNVSISGATAASVVTATVATTITTTTITATSNNNKNNNTSSTTIAAVIANNNQQHGAIYAALSGAHSNVPNTIDPGEYFIS